MQSSSEITAAMFQLDSEAHAPSLAMPEQFSMPISHDERDWTSFGQWNKNGQRMGTSDHDMKPGDPSSKKSLIG